METKEENTNSFQNSPIHWLFYERMNVKDFMKGTRPTLDIPPDLSSMSDCKLKKEPWHDFDKKANDLDLQLILGNITAKFVSMEEYK